MSNYPKYRLKKDTPEFEAGQMFTRGEDEYGNDCLFAGGAPLAAFDVSLIDNFDEWFEVAKEPEKEPTWVRKQIKQIKVVKPDGQPIPEVKYVDINFRYIKDYYHSDVEWGVELCQKGQTDGYPIDVYDDNIISEEEENVIMYLNQLVRDGYIEIQANPNIVWEEL